MKKFEMCPECRREYDDPSDRRFHAQPNACPVCGPYLELWDEQGTILATGNTALDRAAEALRAGRCVGVKGIGGFHLMVDAESDDAVRRLRKRKHREEKPFALLFPGIESVKEACRVSEMEEHLLLSPESPIVLMTHREHTTVAPSVAPGNPYLGVMLPYSPLHHILMREMNAPLVATSGNLSDEPICIDEHEATRRLQGVADLFLVHNRPIVRHVDDSIVRIALERELVLRRARGYAPLPIPIHEKEDRTVVAVGAHLKNTIAMNAGKNVFISQHIGDLETAESYDAFNRVIADFQSLFQKKPDDIVCDVHPEYLSTKYARQQSSRIHTVQHHYAHVAACMMENELDGKLLGVSWDGTGYGLDGTIWGGEFLQTTETSFERVAALRTFRLPGGDLAIREPRRAALGLLLEAFGESVYDHSDISPMKEFEERELAVIRKMLEKKIHSPLTSSVGRLFDAVASIAGVRQIVRHEGQAAMELEFALPESPIDDCYNVSIIESPLPQPRWIVDWSPMAAQLLDDVRRKIPLPSITSRFHNMLVESIIQVAERIGENRIVLTGGCFQNKYLLEKTICRLREEGFTPYWHQRIPPNDGGISSGQIFAFLRSQR
jgi:hydrogenase maturation protein HypF